MRGLLVVLFVCIASAAAQQTNKPAFDLGINFDDVTKPVVDKLNEGLQSALVAFLNQIKDKVNQFGKRSVEFEAKFEQLQQQVDNFRQIVAQRVAELLKQFTDKLQSAYPKLVTDFSNGKRDVEDATKQVQDQLKQFWEGSLGHLQNLLKEFATQSIDKIINYVTKAPQAQQDKREVLKGFQEAFQQILAQLQGHVQNVGQTLVDHGKNVVDNLVPHYDDLKEKLVAHGLNAAQSVLEALKNASQQLANGSAGKREVVNQFQAAFQQLLNALKGHSNNIQETLKGHAQNVVESLMPHYDDLKDQLVAHGLNAAQSVLEALKNASQQLAGAAGKREAEEEVKEKFTESVKKILGESLDHLKSVISQVLNGGLGKVLDAVHPNGPKRQVANQFQAAFQQLLDTLKGHSTNIQDTLKGHAQNVVENLKPHYDDLKEQLIAHGLNAAQSVLEALKNASQQLTQG